MPETREHHTIFAPSLTFGYDDISDSCVTATVERGESSVLVQERALRSVVPYDIGSPQREYDSLQSEASRVFGTSGFGACFFIRHKKGRNPLWVLPGCLSQQDYALTFLVPFPEAISRETDQANSNKQYGRWFGNGGHFKFERIVIRPHRHGSANIDTDI